MPTPAFPHRRHVRYDVELVVEVRGQPGAPPRELRTQDFSFGGTFLLSANPPAIGTHLQLVLDLDHEEQPFTLPCIVVRIVDAEQASARGVRQGFGVRFGGLIPASEARLQELVDAIAELTQEGMAGSAPGAQGGEAHLDETNEFDLARQCEEALEAEHWATAYRFAAPLFQAKPDNRKYEMFYHLSGGLSKLALDQEAAAEHLRRYLQIDPFHIKAVATMRELARPKDVEPIKATKPLWKKLFRIG